MALAGLHHQPIQPVEVIHIGICRVFREPQVRASRKEYFQRDLQFQPRQWCADAKVDTAAEAGVLGAFARRIKPVWVIIG